MRFLGPLAAGEEDPPGQDLLGNSGNPGGIRSGMKGAANHPGDGRTRLWAPGFLGVWTQGSGLARDACLAPHEKSPGFPSRAFFGYSPFPSRVFFAAVHS